MVDVYGFHVGKYTIDPNGSVMGKEVHFFLFGSVQKSNDPPVN